MPADGIYLCRMPFSTLTAQSRKSNSQIDRTVGVVDCKSLGLCKSNVEVRCSRFGGVLPNLVSIMGHFPIKLEIDTSIMQFLRMPGK